MRFVGLGLLMAGPVRHVGRRRPVRQDDDRHGGPVVQHDGRIRPVSADAHERAVNRRADDEAAVHRRGERPKPLRHHGRGRAPFLAAEHGPASARHASHVETGCPARRTRPATARPRSPAWLRRSPACRRSDLDGPALGRPRGHAHGAVCGQPHVSDILQVTRDLHRIAGHRIPPPLRRLSAGRHTGDEVVVGAVGELRDEAGPADGSRTAPSRRTGDSRSRRPRRGGRRVPCELSSRHAQFAESEEWMLVSGIVASCSQG